MRVLPLAAAAVAALSLAIAAPAGAFYHGTVDTGDHTQPTRLVDAGGPTSCAAEPSLTGNTAGPFTYDEFAFRNNGATGTCVTMTGTSTGGCAFPLFDVSLSPGGGLLGSDGPTCSTLHAHSFQLDARSGFVELVTTQTLGSIYDLNFSGTNVVPVLLASINAGLGDGNSVSLEATTLEDGTDPAGTLRVNDGPGGHLYQGPVRCLRVSGANASVVATFTTTTGLASKWKGAVYWIHQSLNGATDGQRNSLLTQQQLDGRYASCPDPNAPPTGSFRTIASQNATRVVANGPQSNN